MFAPRTIPLPPTATYSRRIAVWAGMPHPYADRLGIITVDQHGRMECDWYFVEEWPANQASTRRFQLVKTDGDKSESVVQIGVVQYCTCPAGVKSRTRSCKHAAAIQAIHGHREPVPVPALFDEFSPGVPA